MKYIYSLDFDVRDYECDLQGIVNNANYQHYYEHTRHQFLIAQGFSFALLHSKGIDLVVARIQMAFKSPLRAGDSFTSMLSVERIGIKYRFNQKIVRKSDMTVVNTAVVDSVAIVDGKLSHCAMLDNLIDNLNNN